MNQRHMAPIRAEVVGWGLFRGNIMVDAFQFREEAVDAVRYIYGGLRIEPIYRRVS